MNTGHADECMSLDLYSGKEYNSKVGRKDNGSEFRYFLIPPLRKAELNI